MYFSIPIIVVDICERCVCVVSAQKLARKLRNNAKSFEKNTNAMSDKEEMLDTESGDFSASEDDWLPDKTTQSSSDDEKDFEDVSSRSEKTQKTIKRGWEHK